jgi:hypothetical protein
MGTPQHPSRPDRETAAPIPARSGAAGYFAICQEVRYFSALTNITNVSDIIAGPSPGLPDLPVGIRPFIDN